MMEYCGWMKNIKERLDHNNMPLIAVKYVSDHKKHRYELVMNQKTTQQKFYRQISSQSKFRTRVEFKQDDII